MKRLLPILLLLCLLTGCGKSEAEPPTEPPAADPPVTEQAAQEAPAPDLMDARVPFDETGALWYLPHEAIETGRLQELDIYQDRLLASGIHFMGERLDLQLVLLDLQTGALLYETTLTDISSAYVQVCGSRIAVCDEGAGSIYLFDETLQPVSEHTVADPWDNICVSADGSTAYRFTIDEGIHVTDLASGEKTVLLEQARSLFAGYPGGSMITFSYVDSTTQRTHNASLNLTTGEIGEPPFTGAFSQVDRAGDTWLASLSGHTAHYLGSGEDPFVFDAENRLITLLDTPLRLMLTDYLDDGTVQASLYEPDGTLLSACSLPDAWNTYLTEPIWSERHGGYFLTATGLYGDVQLLFWDLSVPAEGENLTVIPLSERIGHISEGAAVSQSLYDRAAALSEAFGVTIKIADQCATEYMTYTVLQNMDHWQLTAALDALETSLSAYPDGFFAQLHYGSYQDTEINLVGALTPNDLPAGEISGFEAFSAFVEHAYDKHIVVLDAAQNTLEQNFYHEISHIIDDKLAFNARLREDASFDEEVWADFNPENFGYTFSYYNIPDTVYKDGYDSYFIDIYSRTFPSEDRARILEYAMLGWDWIFAQNEPLQAKLVYYAACIRDAFDTTGWPETTAWEQPLNT